MELKEFVKTAIVDIVEAVKEADEEMQKISSSAKVIPPGRYDSIDGAPYLKTEGLQKTTCPITLVGFNLKIEVVESHENAAEMRGGVLRVISGGIEGSAKGAESKVQEVSFSVPLLLPYRK